MNVLLLPDTESGHCVAEQLLEWSAARLLKPFCIWTADGSDPVSVRDVRFGGGVELQLAAALARTEPEAIRFVAFHPVALDEHADAGFADEVERFLLTAREVLDFDPDDPLGCTMVVAPARFRALVPSELFRACWDGLYVAPEDRAQPKAMNELVDDEDRFPRHAAHAAATVAELWATPQANRPELLEELRSTAAGPLAVAVRVVRCFSRAVELGYVADHVAAAAFAAEDGWPRPHAERFERVPDPRPVVRSVAAAYLKKHAATLAARDFDPINEEEPPRLGLLEAIRQLVELLWAYLRRRPFELAEDILAVLYDKAAVYVERLGRSNAIRVRRWHELPPRDHERGLEPMREQLEEPLTIDDGPVEETWSDLRRLTLGLVDGSELPRDVGESALVRGDVRLVICDPARLARDPDEPDADDEQGDEAPLLEQIRALVARALEHARTRAADLDAARAAELTKVVPPVPEDERGPGAQRRRLVALARRTLLRAAVAVAGTAAAWIWLALLPHLLATLALGGAWAVLSVADARRTLLRQRLDEDEWATSELRKLNLALASAQARGDVARLERRRDELETWITILAELVHRPWVREPFGALQLPAPVDHETLPAAFTIAAAKPDRTTLDRVGSRARAEAFSTGWLSTIYRTVTTQAMEEYRIARRLARPVEPAADTSTDPDSPRNALLEAVRRGDGRRLRENPLTADLLRAIDGSLLDELAPHVVPTRDGGRALGPTTTWVDPPSGVRAVASDRAAHAVVVGGTGAAGVIVTQRLVLTAADAVKGARRPSVATDDGTTIRVGDVQLPAGSDLALLHVEDDLVDLLDLTIADDLSRGTPVVALAPSERGVESRWGYVARIGSRVAEVVYDGDHPVLGAPLFDLRGRLVGVHGPRGAALRAKEIETLLAMPTAELATPHAQPAVDEEEPIARSATAFLDAIAAMHGSGLLSPDHWAEPTDANAIELALPPTLALGDGRVDALTGGAAFMRPLRATVHRIEVTRMVMPEELSSCTALQPQAGTSTVRDSAPRSRTRPAKRSGHR